MSPKLRPELKDIPLHMLDLPIDPERGYPVPWFVHWIDGKPEFRVMDSEKWVRAVKEKLCWVCGQKLGANLVFVLGPMCGITRTTSEPACHRDCARWSAKFCPFLSRPHMVRRDDEQLVALGAQSSEYAIQRNPGVALLWFARDFRSHPLARGLLVVGDPVALEWYAEGRTATRAEVDESIRAGIPLLEEIARKEVGGMAALREQVAAFQQYLPAE